MKVRVRMEPHQELGKTVLRAVVESRRLLGWTWNYETRFYGDGAHDRALEYANLLKNPGITEC